MSNPTCDAVCSNDKGAAPVGQYNATREKEKAMLEAFIVNKALNYEMSFKGKRS